MKLVSRDTKGKIRLVSISCDRQETDAGDLYVISRESGLYGGKMIQGPAIEIFKGKAKRTTAEQAALQLNALIKGYRDKGYVELPDGITDVEAFLPMEKTDTKGMLKPMLAKVIDFNDKKLINKELYVDRKYDGCRAFLYCKDGVIQTSSRGGQDYNVAAHYITTDPAIVAFFKDHPDIILDGEIYRHGWKLNKISGLCRLEDLTEDHKELMFYCYDIVDESKTFKDRLALIKAFSASLKDSKIVWVDHYHLDAKSSLEGLKKALMTYHDKFVEEGYEGAIIRDPDATYKCGARDRRLQKLKCMETAEFQIVGISEGLREEDMAFEMVTKEGYPFKAKPEGDRELKKWYHEHIDELKGKMGTVRFFHMSNTEHPVPNLPVFCSIRDTKDM